MPDLETKQILSAKSNKESIKHTLVHIVSPLFLLLLQHITQVLAVFWVGRCLMPNVITWSTGVSWLLSYVQHTRHYELLVKFVIWWPSYLGEILFYFEMKSQAWNFHHKSRKWETLLTWSQGSDGIPTIQPGAQQWHYVSIVITSTMMQYINPSQYVMLNTQCLVNPDTDMITD